MKISIVIPIYNEENAILKTVTSIQDVLKKINNEYEIILINDGSTDNTQSILNSIKDDKISTIQHLHNLGYGASLKNGISKAKYDWILITDADGTYPIDQIPDLINNAENCDMVVGARTGSLVKDTLFRMIGRNIVRKFASYVSKADIKDINSGFRIFKKDTAKQFWHLYPDGFSFTSTITVACFTTKKEVKYVPINYFKRTGKSSIKPAKDFIGFISLITRLAIYFNPLRVFVPLFILFFTMSWVILAYGYFFRGVILDVTWSILLTTSLQIIIFGFLADMIVKRFYQK